ncbi:MAG: NADP-dependent oxidoreductase, partial [Nocardioidaceae bacterium]
MTSTPGHTNTRILLASRPEGEPGPESFTVEQVPAPEPADGELLLRTIYLSLDPYMRGRMSAAKSYAAPTEIGDVMPGGTVCEVVRSRHPDIAEGEVVLSYSGWQSYALAAASAVRRLDPEAAPVSTAVGVLGMPGFT